MDGNVNMCKSCGSRLALYWFGGARLCETCVDERTEQLIQIIRDADKPSDDDIVLESPDWLSGTILDIEKRDFARINSPLNSNETSIPRHQERIAMM